MSNISEILLTLAAVYFIIAVIGGGNIWVAIFFSFSAIFCWVKVWVSSRNKKPKPRPPKPWKDYEV